MKKLWILAAIILLLLLSLTSCDAVLNQLGIATTATETTAPNSGDPNPLAPTEGILYELSTDRSYATAVGYTGTATEVVIADTYQGVPVTKIGDDAFMENETITSVTIPDSVRVIGECAFEKCWRLKSVTIGNGVTSIGACSFCFCESLTSVTIPDSVTSIGNSAFSCCSSLTSVTIGNGVVSIGWYAFYDCESLTSVIIPESVTEIGSSAFRFCDSLTSVTIPESVTSIGWYAFSGCSSLESILVAPGNPTYHSDGNCLIETTSKTLITGCGNSVIPSNGSVTSIGNEAFSYCTSLSSVTIPNGVTTIGEQAFAGCSSLGTIYYEGTEAEWAAIEKGSSYKPDSCTVVYNYGS